MVTRPGVYYINIPFDQVRPTITDGAKNKIIAKGVQNQYITTLIVDQSEIGTPASKFLVVMNVKGVFMNAPSMPPFKWFQDHYHIRK